MTSGGIVLVGAGGHAEACLDVIEAEGKFTVVGLVGSEDEVGREVAGHRILGTDEELPTLVQQGHSFLVAVGQVRSPDRRSELFHLLSALGAPMPVVVAPSAIVSRSSLIGAGSILMHRVTVGPSAIVGDNCIVNNGALLEHGVHIGSHSHVSTGAVVNGAARVGNGTFIGSGSVLSHGVEVPDNCVLGAGSVVTRSLTAAGTYVGQPVRRLG